MEKKQGRQIPSKALYPLDNLQQRHRLPATLHIQKGSEESIKQGKVLSPRQVLTQKCKLDGEQEGTQAACDPP